MKSLKIESWKVWSENSDDGEISPRTSGIIPNVFMLCKVRLCMLPALFLSQIVTHSAGTHEHAKILKT